MSPRLLLPPPLPLSPPTQQQQQQQQQHYQQQLKQQLLLLYQFLDSLHLKYTMNFINCLQHIAQKKQIKQQTYKQTDKHQIFFPHPSPLLPNIHTNIKSILLLVLC